MRVFFVVNEVGGLKPGQTTTALAAASAARGLETVVVSAADLGIRPDGTVTALGVSVPVCSASELPARLRSADRVPRPLGQGDRVWIRTNPGRDARLWITPTMLDLLGMAERAGVIVRNRPAALRRASSKLFLHALPERIRPRTLVSRDPLALRAFLEDCAEGAVFKPLDGTQGRDVFRIRSGSTDNLNQIIDLLTRDGFCMAQSFVPEALAGDVRLILVNGSCSRWRDTRRRCDGCPPAPTSAAMCMWAGARFWRRRTRSCSR